MPTLTTSSPAVVKAARKMNAIVNEACGTDAEDSWKFYSETYKSDALTALQAAGVGELVEALKASRIALDDWLNTYAAEHCDARRVCEAYERIKNNGGTLSYLADIQTTNRACLKTFTGSES